MRTSLDFTVVPLVNVFWLRICTYVFSLTFLFTFSTAFLSSFIPENFLTFVCPILSPFTLKSNQNFLVIFRKFSASFPQASLTFHSDAVLADMKVESLPITTAAFKGLKVSHNTLDGIRLGFKTLRIYISAHFVSTSFKILLVCWQAWIWKKRRSRKQK